MNGITTAVLGVKKDNVLNIVRNVNMLTLIMNMII